MSRRARINLDVPEAELARRRAEWKPPEPRYERGYGWMFTRHIKQANEGCDFDFLETGFGAPVGEPVDLLTRHSGATRSVEPGISRFRVWSFGPSRNDGNLG